MKSSGNTSSSTSFTQLTGTFSFPLELSVPGVSLPYLVGGSYWYSRLEFGLLYSHFLECLYILQLQLQLLSCFISSEVFEFVWFSPRYCLL